MEQAPEVTLSYSDYLATLRYPQLVALAELTGALKSLLIGFALHSSQLSIEQAVHASRLEEDVQMERYGLVEGGHDVDIVDLRTRAAGAALFLKLYELEGTAGSAQQDVHRDVSKALRNLESLGL
eukprot:TRINITY_DN59533_c0_g1_i1.p2 TRINITY_DN59533_c0_g1~~TRINITY_DN59533_c0_g1_i1.p2  ORF type:complete len:146 (-),score=17.03 TRINITY_DN59533_c0_g1_i1:315-689(-)